jgi:UPF0716 protein FxsA
MYRYGLFVAFVAVPLVEVFLLLWLGSLLGAGPSFLVVVITGVLGAWLAKREGLGVLRTLRTELGKGLPPGSRLVEGGMVLAGGLLLMTPGILTDLTGFLLIAPPSRRYLAPRLLSAVMKRLDLKVDLGAGRSPAPTGAAPEPFANPFDDLP